MSWPLAARKPAWKAADCPWPEPFGVLVMERQRTQGREDWWARAFDLVVSVEPSLTRMNSKVIPSGSMAASISSMSRSTFSSSLWAGARMVSSILTSSISGLACESSVSIEGPVGLAAGRW